MGKMRTNGRGSGADANGSARTKGSGADTNGSARTKGSGADAGTRSADAGTRSAEAGTRSAEAGDAFMGKDAGVMVNGNTGAGSVNAGAGLAFVGTGLRGGGAGAADWFPHGAGLRNDMRVRALRRRCGASGYAVWLMLLEALAARDGFRMEWDGLSQELVAADFDVECEELVAVVEVCVRLGLLAFYAIPAGGAIPTGETPALPGAVLLGCPLLDRGLAELTERREAVKQRQVARREAYREGGRRGLKKGPTLLDNSTDANSKKSGENASRARVREEKIRRDEILEEIRKNEMRETTDVVSHHQQHTTHTGVRVGEKRLIAAAMGAAPSDVSADGMVSGEGGARAREMANPAGEMAKPAGETPALPGTGASMREWSEEDKFRWCLGVYNAELEACAREQGRSGRSPVMKFARVLTDQRRRALRYIMAHYNGHEWRRAMRNAAHSDFCNGRSKARDRAVELDWLIDPGFPGRFVSLLEGTL